MKFNNMPTSQRVTWVIKKFFDLRQKERFYLDSPDFLFCGDSYCLRLYTKVKSAGCDNTEIRIRRLSETFPERRISGSCGIRWREPNGDVRYDYRPISLVYPCYISRPLGEMFVPDGIFTMVCSFWLSDRSGIATAQGEEQLEGFPGCDASFSNRWSSTKMELTTEFPSKHVDLHFPYAFTCFRNWYDDLIFPEFRFAGDTYCLRFCRNRDAHDTELQLFRLTSNFPERTVSYRVGYGCKDQPAYPNNCRSLVGSSGLCVLVSKLLEERNKYIRGGTLELVLFLHLRDHCSTGAGTSNVAQERSGLTGIYKLQSDYGQLLRKGTDSDACFVVRGKEFQVHRAVLRARSSVFEAMFGHEMAEKESGRVVVDDLDSDTFEDFLQYLYTGDVQDKLSDDNAFDLYEAADKYDVSTLKSECVEHMHRTLSVDSFCDVMTLALRHREEDLLQQAISFFKDNLQRIIITAKWQQFNIDNGATANELFIKALVPRCTW